MSTFATIKKAECFGKEQSRFVAAAIPKKLDSASQKALLDFVYLCSKYSQLYEGTAIGTALMALGSVLLYDAIASPGNFCDNLSKFAGTSEFGAIEAAMFAYRKEHAFEDHVSQDLFVFRCARAALVKAHMDTATLREKIIRFFVICK